MIRPPFHHRLDRLDDIAVAPTIDPFMLPEEGIGYPEPESIHDLASPT